MHYFLLNVTKNCKWLFIILITIWQVIKIIFIQIISSISTFRIKKIKKILQFNMHFTSTNKKCNAKNIIVKKKQ